MNYLLTMLALSILCCTGCDGEIQPPATSNDCFVGYGTNCTYTTIVPLMLVIEQPGDYKLYSFGDFGRLPETVEEYKHLPSKWPDVKAVLPLGTEVRFSKMTVVHRFESGSVIHAYGILVEFSNTLCRLDYISDTSTQTNGVSVPTPRLKVLSPAKR